MILPTLDENHGRNKTLSEMRVRNPVISKSREKTETHYHKILYDKKAF